MQQKDLENREHRQNLWICGVPKSINDKKICPYFLCLFVTLVPHIPDIDWCLDRAHISLAPEPPAGSNPRDIIVHFHYNESNEALNTATCNKTCMDLKGDTILQSPVTHHLGEMMQPMSHNYSFTKSSRYLLLGVPFLAISLKRWGTVFLQESEAFLHNLGLPPLPAEDLLAPPSNIMAVLHSWKDLDPHVAQIAESFFHSSKCCFLHIPHLLALQLLYYIYTDGLSPICVLQILV